MSWGVFKGVLKQAYSLSVSGKNIKKWGPYSSLISHHNTAQMLALGVGVMGAIIMCQRTPPTPLSTVESAVSRQFSNVFFIFIFVSLLVPYNCTVFIFFFTSLSVIVTFSIYTFMIYDEKFNI